MRWMSAFLTVVILFIPAWANTGDRSKFGFNPTRLELKQAMSQPQEGLPSSTDSTLDIEGKLVPGKAMMLSAILPGAGQFYAKNYLLAAAFLAIEIGAWVGVATNHIEGMDKEDEFEAYADAHWRYDDPSRENNPEEFPNFIGLPFYDYLTYEFWAATQFGNETKGVYPYPDPSFIDQWDALPWGPLEGKEDKLDYLPSNGFTHELDPDEKDQQYYETIGKYAQFAPGWPDYEEDSAATWQPNQTVSPMRDHYLNLRKASNDALDMSKNFTMVVLGNHLLSALHAGFSVSMHNRKLAKEQRIEGAFYLEPKKYKDERLTMGVLRIRF